jgi:hypothetical protein
MRPQPPERSADEGPDPADLKGEPCGALALAEGCSIVEAARRAGVSERTIRRRLATPRYRSEVALLRAKVLDAALGQLIAATTAAVTVLVELLGARSETVRLAAASRILEHALELRELTEVEGRVQSLEQVLLRRTEEVRVSWAGVA